MHEQSENFNKEAVNFKKYRREITELKDSEMN